MEPGDLRRTFAEAFERLRDEFLANPHASASGRERPSGTAAPRSGSPPLSHQGRDLFDGVVARALEAQRRAPPERRPAHDHIAAPASIAAEVKRLTDDERAALLAYFASIEQDMRRFPYQQNYFINTFKALLNRLPPLTREAATDLFLTYARRAVLYGPPINGLAGFRKALRLMEAQGGAGAFAGHGPLLDAYAALRERFPVFDDSGIVSAEMEAQAVRILGLEQGGAAPDGAPEARSPDGDGPHVDAYAAALEARLSEVLAWEAAIRARRPDYFEEAAEAVGHVGRVLPISRVRPWVRPDMNGAPLACLSSLEPPPPAWFIEGCGTSVETETASRLEYGPTPGTLSVLSWVLRFAGRPDAGFFDRDWLTRAREVHLATSCGWADRDWSSAEVAAADLLRPGGPGDADALHALVWRARTPAPNKRWLDDANRLLSSLRGPGALAAAARWLDEVAALPGRVPTPASHQLAGIFRSFCEHAREVLAAHGGDPDAAAMTEIRSGGPLGYDSYGARGLQRFEDHRSVLSEENDTVLRGCVWLLALVPGPETVERLRRLALACLVQAPAAREGVKYRSLKGLNACVWALGRIATPEAVTALGRVKLKARDERIAKQIAKAMAEAAGRAGMTIEDLEEIAVPTFGLEGGGCSRIGLAGGCSAELSVASGTEAAVSLLRADGKPAKGVPAAVKADAESAAALRAFKASAKELSQALPVQRLRLERSWLSGRAWTGAAFRARFLDHPLMAWFAARLVWAVAPAGGGGPVRTCMFRDGGPVDARDRPAPPLRDDDSVSLWHPLAPGAEPDAVALWRAFLFRNAVVQPIKQAHREVYPLTPAEEAAATYSNRFAGHILRQHQSAALARLRGWSVRLRVSADVPNDEPTHIKLPALGMAAEFWTERAGGDDAEVSDSLAYLFIGTDRVRFRRLVDTGDWRRDGGRGLALGAEAVPLREVPPVAFSEVMRDVDLMVGVSSIGHDPAWLDGGGDAQHPSQWRRGQAADYWRGFNAAELTGSGEARRAFLAELLPKLAIADRCELAERHLVVRGKLRTYRIHLGSGNVAMEPDGRYLCVVAKGEGEPATGVFLPFEGDRLLSVVLSKAFLLARDEAITDPTILRQIGA